MKKRISFRKIRNKKLYDDKGKLVRITMKTNSKQEMNVEEDLGKKQ